MVIAFYRGQGKGGGEELKALFSKAGDVMSVNVVAGKHTGQPRGNAS